MGKKVSDFSIFLKLLLEDYEERKLKNSSYSKRAYAKFLGVPASTLHELMKGRLAGYKSLIARIGKKIGLSPEEIEFFTLLGKKDRLKNPVKRSELYRQALSLNTRFNSLNDEQFCEICEWYHFAVMELLKTDDAQNDVEWVAKKLSISKEAVKKALHSLERLDILKVKSDGSIHFYKDFVAVPSGAPLKAAQNFHKMMIEKSLEAVDKQPKGTRNFSSLTLRFRKKDISKVDEFLNRVRREFSDEFEGGEGHDSVYALNIQFVRLDKELS